MTDFYKMSSMMKDLFPSNPEADKQALKAMAGQPQESVAPTKDYVQESVQVPQGSMPLGIDNVSDFAKLAGITETQKTGSAGQAKGKDPMPKAEPGRTKHPLKDKLVGEDVFDQLGTLGDTRMKIEQLGKELGLRGQYLQTFITFVFDAHMKLLVRQEQRPDWPTLDDPIDERELTKGEEKEKERLVKGMKKNKSDFKDRYGKDAEAVMYATATKNAKNESTHSSIKDRLLAELNKRK